MIAYSVKQVMGVARAFMEHLAWLEVFGGILGIAFSEAFIGISRLVSLW